jgi:hypothetical protein
MIYHHVILEVCVRPTFLCMDCVKRYVYVKYPLLASRLNISLAKKFCDKFYDHGDPSTLCYSPGRGGYRRRRNREQCRTTDLQGDTF